MNQSVKTQTVGELLTAARQDKQLSLKAVSQQTYIKLDYLQAIEDNNFVLLPSASYVKAYIKSYARLLDLDPSPLLAILRRDYQESARGQLISREFLKPALSKRANFSSVRLVLLAIGALFITFFAYAGWQWYQLNRPPALIITSPSEGEQVSGQVQVTGRTTVDALLLVNAQPVALSEDGSFSTDIYLPVEGPSTITVRATDQRGKTSTLQRNVQVAF